MHVTKLNLIFEFIAAATCFVLAPSARAQSISPAEPQQIATDVSIHGYSLIAIRVTWLQAGSVPKVGSVCASPNEVAKVSRYGRAPSRAG